MNIDNLLKQLNLFWQYPVITEKEFYKQNTGDPNYFPFPWATVIDKRVNQPKLCEILKGVMPQNKNYYTCCQHIRYKELNTLWNILGIKTIYTPHKCIGIDVLGSIKLIACPLYAVNIEDDSRNKDFKKYNLLEKERKYFYSFAGGYQSNCYLTDIRLRIFNLNKKNRNDCMIKNTGDWHFNCDVYGGGQDANGKLNEDQRHQIKTNIYNGILLDSRYALAPSGSGPNSIRFWEALGAGSIPVLLADTLELPVHELWDKAIVRIKESDLDKLDDILTNISNEEEQERRDNCMKLYRHFRNNYKNKKNRKILHYCCGSYDKGDFGGVARFDYMLSLVAPNRIHFYGPREKTKLLDYLSQNQNALVIADNHLVCDIPNKYEVLLVHHGCALTTAERNPSWSEPWKSLCTNGQKDMLYYRDTKTTTILSTAQSCTDDFTKYFGDVYTKFKIKKLLHSSELPEGNIKMDWSKEKPIVLGNIGAIKKGGNIFRSLSIKYKDYSFRAFQLRGNKDFNSFLQNKRNIYMGSDIFLQLSNSEAGPYASIDALLCGVPVVATNVGVFENDVPEDCFVKIDVNRRDDLEYVYDRINYAWKNKEKIGKKGYDWYMKNMRLKDWKKSLGEIINDI